MNGDFPKLLDADQALSHYLDSLLQDLSGADAVPRFEAIPGVEEDAAGVERFSGCQEGAVLLSTARPAVEPEPPPTSGPKPEWASKAEPELEPAPERAPQTALTPPVWAQDRFQCLSFQVAGLPLAVPRIKVNGIIEVSDFIKPMPGDPWWLLGLIQHRGRQVKVVDIGMIVVPQDRGYHPVPPRYIVFLDGYRWGIACDGITGMLTLNPKQVRWRNRLGRRPWLAGTVIDPMCAILDVDRLARDLDSGAWGSSVRNGVSEEIFGRPDPAPTAGSTHREPGQHASPNHPQQRNDES